MLNYKAWIERAVRFTERVRQLPGETEVESRAAPPLRADKVEALRRRLPLGLPLPFSNFLSRGSASFSFTYSWDVPQRLVARLEAVFPSKECLLGGSTFCNGRELPAVQSACLEWGAALDKDYPEDKKIWSKSVPFLQILNGDYLALYVGPGRRGRQAPVAYLDHDGCGFSRIIAGSFDQFLRAWEGLYYVNPLELRTFFVDPISGYLNSTSRKKFQLQELLELGVQSRRSGERPTTLIRRQPG